MDARDEFAESFCLPPLHANALYEGKYPLVSALARPLIAEKTVALAREVGAEFVAHGCTGKGNDQVRFEATFAALAPDLRCWRPSARPATRATRRCAVPPRSASRSPPKPASTPSTRTCGAAPPSAVPSRTPGPNRPRTHTP